MSIRQRSWKFGAAAIRAGKQTLTGQGFVATNALSQAVIGLDEWTWDPRKNARNLAKHGLPLASRALVLNGDPRAVSRPDIHPDGDRWQTIGSAGGVVVLLVVHTDPETDALYGRIISVRKATNRERKAYTNGCF
jgi:uncharacterized DUF497 family protein